MKPKQENQDIRDYAKNKGVMQWQIANQYGIHVMTLINRLRKPFTGDERKEMMQVINDLEAQK